MQIAVITTGARGDTEPFVALAVRLMRDGHSVMLAARLTSPNLPWLMA